MPPRTSASAGRSAPRRRSRRAAAAKRLRSRALPSRAVTHRRPAAPVLRVARARSGAPPARNCAGTAHPPPAVSRPTGPPPRCGTRVQRRQQRRNRAASLRRLADVANPRVLYRQAPAKRRSSARSRPSPPTPSSSATTRSGLRQPGQQHRHHGVERQVATRLAPRQDRPDRRVLHHARRSARPSIATASCITAATAALTGANAAGSSPAAAQPAGNARPSITAPPPPTAPMPARRTPPPDRCRPHPRTRQGCLQGVAKRGQGRPRHPGAATQPLGQRHDDRIER